MEDEHQRGPPVIKNDARPYYRSYSQGLQRLITSLPHSVHPGVPATPPLLLEERSRPCVPVIPPPPAAAGVKIPPSRRTYHTKQRERRNWIDSVRHSLRRSLRTEPVERRRLSRRGGLPPHGRPISTGYVDPTSTEAVPVTQGANLRHQRRPEPAMPPARSPPHHVPLPPPRRRLLRPNPDVAPHPLLCIPGDSNRERPWIYSPDTFRQAPARPCRFDACGAAPPPAIVRYCGSGVGVILRRSTSMVGSSSPGSSNGGSTCSAMMLSARL